MLFWPVLPTECSKMRRLRRTAKFNLSRCKAKLTCVDLSAGRQFDLRRDQETWSEVDLLAFPSVKQSRPDSCCACAERCVSVGTESATMKRVVQQISRALQARAADQHRAVVNSTLLPSECSTSGRCASTSTSADPPAQSHFDLGRALCWKCGEQAGGGFFCARCQAIQPPNDAASFYSILGMCAHFLSAPARPDDTAKDNGL